MAFQRFLSYSVLKILRLEPNLRSMSMATSQLKITLATLTLNSEIYMSQRERSIIICVEYR